MSCLFASCIHRDQTTICHTILPRVQHAATYDSYQETCVTHVMAIRHPQPPRHLHQSPETRARFMRSKWPPGTPQVICDTCHVQATHAAPRESTHTICARCPGSVAGEPLPASCCRRQAAAKARDLPDIHLHVASRTATKQTCVTLLGCQSSCSACVHVRVCVCVQASVCAHAEAAAMVVDGVCVCHCSVRALRSHCCEHWCHCLQRNAPIFTVATAP